MDGSLRRRINELAKDVLNVYNISIPIEDIDSVVQKIGGTVIESDKMDFLTDGTIKKNEDSFSITVPASQRSNVRRNFTVAHELGHLFLHMGYQIDEERWNKSNDVEYNRQGNSESELEANEFAAALLMPEDKYFEVMNKYTKDNAVFINKIAEFFHVSIEAASYRGKWLGYLKW